jgi:S1-C subfamily serine protease
MWLLVTSGPLSGTTVEVVAERFTIGRDQECDLTLPDETASREHAVLSALADGGALLTDQGSTNGTYVNGVRVEAPVILQGGERLQVGDTLLTASVRDPREPAAADGERWSRRVVVGVGVAGALAAAALVGGVLVATSRGSGHALTTSQIVARIQPSTAYVMALQKGQLFASGTGWVYDGRRRLVVTNHHVVNDGDTFQVKLAGRSFPAKVVGSAPCEDLSVLRLAGQGPLPALPLASESDLRAGDSVVALGFPATGTSAPRAVTTAGIVSVVHTRFTLTTLDTPHYPNLIQTTAAINPGNSGGPLVDDQGRLVGVNSAGITLLGGRTIQGQGYAIGVDRVKQIVPQLAAGHSMAWTGMGLDYPTSAGDLTKLGLPAEKGLIVTHAVPGSPAARKGFGAVNALVVAIDGHTMDGTLSGYCAAVNGARPGAPLTVSVVTANAPDQVQTVQVPLE